MTIESLATDENVVDSILWSLTRSKAIWMNPELLNLVESAASPRQADRIVFMRTGSRKKGRAAHAYACALRDHPDAPLGALIAVLRSPNGLKKLEAALYPRS